MTTHRVVIIGGGFGGLQAALHLRKAPVEVTLVDRRNFHLFQPLLYQVATGGLSPANIAAPLRNILSRQKNTRVLLGEAVSFDVIGRRVLLSDGELGYDSLILATGSRHHYFGNEHWEPIAPGLKTIEDATEIRRRILLAFEAAERETDPGEVAEWLTFVVVGGGPTGVELAGTLAEVARVTLRHEFRHIDTRKAKIILVEGTNRILPPYPSELSAKATQALERLGVTVICGALVTAARPEGVLLRRDGKEEEIIARTILWGAGVIASPLGRKLAEATGAEVDRMGRIVVLPDLTVPGHPNLFVIGDLAHVRGVGGQPLPGVAPVAIQQGRYAARLIAARLRGKSLKPFQYWNHGSMATIGRAAGVAEIGRLRFNGFLAWLAWLFIHLLYLVGHENRLLVLTQWAWNYFTRNRSARLITGESPLPLKGATPEESLES